MSTFSLEYQKYLQKKKKEKRIILFAQIFILLFLLGLWEILAHFHLINTFLTSSPSMVIKTFFSLFKNNDLLTHITTTLLETFFSFLMASMIGIGVSTLLWWNHYLAKIIDPYLTILNSLPKVALGPLIIIWVGASVKSIIFMALLICIFLSIINIYHDFEETNENYLTLLKSLGATKKDLFFKVVFPSNLSNIMNNLKINISMAYIGT